MARPMAKGRNAATGPVRRALQELARRAAAALRPLPICSIWLRAAPCIDAPNEL